MGNITIALENEDELKLRRLAKQKFDGKKGSLAKVVSEGINKLNEEEKRTLAREKLLEMMKKGYRMGKMTIKHRSELYDRG